ncbi:MAG: type II toxin-antitoxin system Phd/YefM family antitoxin [Victivallales bacterium]|jgi:prevent-host-death family protein
MQLHNTVKSISYVKSHASEILNRISDSHATYVITQNGEAKAVIQDIKEYDNMQESLAMLKLIAQGRKDVAEKKIRPRKESFNLIREKIKAIKSTGLK